MFTFSSELMRPQHGGDLIKAVQQYQIPLEDWIDLSTGISPWGYPVQDLDNSVWRDLPPDNDALLSAASQYYQVNKSSLLVSPGSQLSIRLLPQLLERSSVAIPALGYQEHPYSWRLAGHTVHFYKDLSELLSLIDQQLVNHVVIINPNNPSCEKLTINEIEKVSKLIAGSFIIDEAFIDCSSKGEVLESAIGLGLSNTIIFRSIGKFFGLAGLRVGFVIGEHPILNHLRLLLEPWSVSHASMVIAERVLLDTEWQHEQRQRIQSYSSQMLALLHELGQNLPDVQIKSAGLFSTMFAKPEVLKQLHHLLANKGVWTRLFNTGDNPAWLRFSLSTDIQSLRARLR